MYVGGIRLIQQFYAWDYGAVLEVHGFESSRVQVVPAC